MKVFLTDESYKASTSLNQIIPIRLEGVEGYKNSKVFFQILLSYEKKVHVTLGNTLSIADNLKEDIFRVSIESELKTKMYLVDYYKDSNNIEYADKLLSEKEKSYDGGRYIPILVEVDLPKNQPSGNFELIANVYHSFPMGDEEKVFSETLNIHVNEFSFLEDDFKLFKTDIWQQPSNLARQYKVSLWSDEHFKLIEKMASSLSKIGQKAVTIIASECPWKGWYNYIVKDYPANLYEYTMIPIKKDRNGKLHCDFTIMQRYIDIFKKYEIYEEIDVFGLLGVWEPPFFPKLKIMDYPERLVLRYFDEETKKYHYLKDGNDIRDYIRQLFQYFKETNQIDKVRIMADEPQNNLEATKKFKESAEELKGINHEVRLKVAFDKVEVLNQLLPLVSHPVTSFYCTCENIKELKKERDKQLSFYVCNYPDAPNTFLSSPLLESRLIGSYAFLFGIDGFTRWAYNCWPINAKDDIRYNVGNLTTGDVCLVYPCENGEILESMRMKNLRRGIEDFILLKKAVKINEKAVKECISKIFLITEPEKFMKNSHEINKDIFNITYEKFETMRKELISIIKEK